MGVEVRDLVSAGDVGGVRAWLDAGGDPDQTDPATNQTLLMAAAFEGRLEVVRLLLGRGAGREGALFGTTPDEAFYVKCDAETNPPESIDEGKLVVEVGVAPVKPAEFVIFRIGQWQGGASVE